MMSQDTQSLDELRETIEYTDVDIFGTDTRKVIRNHTEIDYTLTSIGLEDLISRQYYHYKTLSVNNYKNQPYNSNLSGYDTDDINLQKYVNDSINILIEGSNCTLQLDLYNHSYKNQSLVISNIEYSFGSPRDSVCEIEHSNIEEEIDDIIKSFLQKYNT